MKEDSWNLCSMVEEGEGDEFMDDLWNVCRVEGNVGRMGEPGGDSALGLI